MEEIEPTELQCTNRWLAYFDLLGFKNLVRDNHIEYVISIYKEALSHLKRSTEPNKEYGISFFWFSDTFIIFSKSDSVNEFAYVEQVSRLFFQRLILNKIPVRGSLTVGELYIHQENNIFVGKALIDAYEYGEKQKWLGFLLTPAVYCHLKDSSITLERRPFYRLVDMPGVITHDNPKNVYAFAFNNGQVNGRNMYLDALESMKAEAETDEVRKKYINTEKFIRKHGKLTVVSD